MCIITLTGLEVTMAFYWSPYRVPANAEWAITMRGLLVAPTK